MDNDLRDILIRNRDATRIGAPDRSLRRRAAHGDLIRIAPGVFAPAGQWERLDSLAQHRTLVLATADRLVTPVVFSHHAAAALWGIRILGRWPATVDVTLERASGGRSDGLLRRHCTGLERTDVTALGRLAVTSPAQTVVDLARVLPFADAVVAMDSALHRKRPGGPLTTTESVMERCELLEGRRGWRRAQAAAEFATGLSDSPEESHSRVQIHLAGFPAPVLQRRFVDGKGFVAETDFFWPEYDHAGECDGRAKYRDPAYLRGRTPADVVIEEKNRENRLRRLVGGLSRWEPADLYPPSRMVGILVRAGLPRSRG